MPRKWPPTASSPKARGEEATPPPAAAAASSIMASPVGHASAVVDSLSAALQATPLSSVQARLRALADVRLQHPVQWTLLSSVGTLALLVMYPWCALLGMLLLVVAPALAKWYRQTVAGLVDVLWDALGRAVQVAVLVAAALVWIFARGGKGDGGGSGAYGYAYPLHCVLGVLAIRQGVDIAVLKDRFRSA